MDLPQLGEALRGNASIASFATQFSETYDLWELRGLRRGFAFALRGTAPLLLSETVFDNGGQSRTLHQISSGEPNVGQNLFLSSNDEDAGFQRCSAGIRLGLMTTSTRSLLLAMGLLSLGLDRAQADDIGFTDPGFLAGGSTAVANGVSADGSIVVGFGDNSGAVPEAFRWSPASGMLGLGMLNNGDQSFARAVSADGSVIVGQADDGAAGNKQRAFRWTQSGGMESLGTLSGSPNSDSSASATNRDGSVVVGLSDDPASSTAFRWTSSGGMESLGELNNGNFSVANGVSGGGLVVVGNAHDGNSSNAMRAVRWTAGAGSIESLGTLNNGDYSTAAAISDDGSTIVGYADDGSFSNRGQAVLWTSGASSIRSLGQLNSGDYSEALAVNGDGTVVVGDAHDGADSNTQRAYRWTQTDGMITVEQWMRNHGVTVSSDFTEAATGVSSDGNVVVGNTDQGTAFIARAVASTPTGGGTQSGTAGGDSGPTKSGIIDFAEYANTLQGKPTTQVGLTYANTVLQGAHGEPMRDLLKPGQHSFSVTSDIGYDDSHVSKGGLGVGDLSFGYGLGDGITARFAGGGIYTRQDIDTGGHFREDAFYLAPEASIALGESNVYATVGAYYSSGRVDVHRGYLNGGSMDYSDGDADVDTWGGKIRFDWLNAATISDTKLTPYTSLTYAHSHMDGYTEEGGSFPSTFDAVNDHSNVARLGIDFVHDLTDKVRLTARTEADYRFEKNMARTSGEILGISAFSLTGEEIRQFWFRGAVGTEFDVAGGTASLGVNVTTEGNDPDVWLRSGWSMKF